MPRTASAPTFVGDGKIVFTDRDYPDPGPGQLLLSVEANAICGTDRVGQIITHRMPRSQIAEAFDLFLAGETGKVIVEADPS